MSRKLSCLIGLFLLTFSLQGFAQQKTITGTVTDQKGVPLPSVNITVKGTSKGTSTDFDGNYTIQAEPGKILTFNYVGFKEVTRRVLENESVINVEMETGEALDEVVITGYQDIDKQLFTGAAQTLTNDEFTLEGTQDVSRMLQGKAAGVTVQNVSGTFGSAPRITIRGSSSILGDTRPLFVVDGAIQEGIKNVNVDDLASGDASTLLGSELAGLNASDIKSIEILRDASATALYGARALNGVIAITTKTGQREAPNRINYSATYTMRAIPTYSQFDLLNSQEDLSIYRELENKGFLTIANTLQNRYGGLYNLMYRKINNYIPGEDTFGVVNTPEAKARFLQGYEYNNTDWFNVLFRSTPTQTHSLSYSGGSENSTSYASLSYFTDPGWTIADRVRRLTGNIQNSYYFADDKIKATLQLTSSFRDQNAPGTFDSQNDTFTGSISRNFDINPFSYALNTSRALRPYDDQGNYEYLRYNWAPFNIIDELNNNQLNIKVNDLRFRAGLEADLTPDLKYKFLGTARYAFSTTEQEINENANAANAYRAAETTIVQENNIFLFTDPDQPNQLPRVVLPYGGILRRTDNKITTYTYRNTLEYDKTFDDVHNFKVYAGQEYRQTDRSENVNTDYGVQFNKGNTPFIDPDIIRKTTLAGDNYYSLNQTRNRGVTFFTNLSYDYDRKYILNLVGNYEGSNRAGRSSSARWLPTYNIAGRWNLHQEDFVKDDLPWVNNLALRASYGLVGIISNAASNNLPVFQSNITPRRLNSNRENVIDIIDLQNQELTYEKTIETNVGLDVGVLNNRFSMTANAYYRRGKDLIDIVRTSGIGGEFQKLGNNANMTTKGIELQLNSTNIKTDEFSWRSSLNVSAFNQEITDLVKRPTVFDLVTGTGDAVLGYSRASIWSFDFDRLNEDGLPIYDLGVDENGDPVDGLTGINFQDLNNVTDYLKYEGRVEPNFTGGLTNNFNYKNFSFSFFINFSAGNVIRLTPRFSGAYSDLSVFSEDFLDRWLVPGDELRTDVPTIASTQLRTVYTNVTVDRAYNAYNYSDQRIAKGDYVRMRNISLGYTFPSYLTEQLNLTQMKLTAQATNPFLIYSDDALNGQDPEFIRSGGVASPVARNYTLTLNIGF